MAFNAMGGGFYAGIFYPETSPLYNPGTGSLTYGACFAPIGKGALYKGFLFETAELRQDYYLYA